MTVSRGLNGLLLTVLATCVSTLTSTATLAQTVSGERFRPATTSAGSNIDSQRMRSRSRAAPITPPSDRALTGALQESVWVEATLG